MLLQQHCNPLFHQMADKRSALSKRVNTKREKSTMCKMPGNNAQTLIWLVGLCVLPNWEAFSYSVSVCFQSVSAFSIPNEASVYKICALYRKQCGFAWKKLREIWEQYRCITVIFSRTLVQACTAVQQPCSRFVSGSCPGSGSGFPVPSPYPYQIC